jgi:hypothetical protein
MKKHCPIESVPLFTLIRRSFDFTIQCEFKIFEETRNYMREEVIVADASNCNSNLNNVYASITFNGNAVMPHSCCHLLQKVLYFMQSS